MKSKVLTSQANSLKISSCHANCQISLGSPQDPDATLQKVLDFFGHHVRARLLPSFSACVVDFAFLEGQEQFGSPLLQDS